MVGGKANKSIPAEEATCGKEVKKGSGSGVPCTTAHDFWSYYAFLCGNGTSRKELCSVQP